MQKIIIEEEINFVEKFSPNKLVEVFEYLLNFNYESIKFLFFAIVTINFLFIIITDIFFRKKMIDLSPFKKYIFDCKNFIKYKRYKTINKYPYISVCIPVFNMEKFIEKNLISILNQSFQNFHIIIVNDASNDKTDEIIRRIQLDDKRIKLISHKKTLGVYRSRIESILNSKSKFILLMDPDDMYLNINLFKELYYIKISFVL